MLRKLSLKYEGYVASGHSGLVICYFVCQVDRAYLRSPNVIAVLDHEKKRTFVLRKEGLSDVGKLPFV